MDHSQWDRLLKRHVNAGGLVDYQGFKSDRAQLKDYLGLLAANIPNERWEKSEKLAYYINAYNAYTIELILQHYPVESIKDISAPWGQKFIPLGTQRISLDHLENRILRQMDEPRIHFAINCASRSCPPLLNEAFTADRLEEQLERVTSAFINGPLNDLKARPVRISRIFKWYRRDFRVDGQVDVVGYLNRYAKANIGPEAKIDYLDYSWELNKVQQ